VGVGGEVEVFGAVAPASIEAVAVQVLSADQVAAVRHEDRPAGLPCADQWVVAPPWARAGVQPCADQWAVAPLWVQAGVQPCADQWVAAPL